MRLPAAISLILLVATGCQNDPSDPPDAARTTTTSTSTTSTTAPVDFAQQYLEVVAPTNCALDRVAAVEADIYGPDDRVDETDWPRLRDEWLPAARQVTESLVGFYEALVNAEWPPDLKVDIDNLVRELSDDAATTARTLAGITSFEDYIAWEPPSSGNAAGVIRARLGLPANIGTASDGIDWCAGPPPAPATTAPAR